MNFLKQTFKHINKQSNNNLFNIPNILPGGRRSGVRLSGGKRWRGEWGGGLRPRPIRCGGGGNLLQNFYLIFLQQNLFFY